MNVKDGVNNLTSERKKINPLARFPSYQTIWIPINLS